MAKKIDLDGLEHFKAKENASIAGTEASSTASKAYTVGQHFYFKGTLVVCTVDIVSGGTITLNTNCKTVPLADEVSDLKTATIKLDNFLFKIPLTPSNMSVDENGKIYIEQGYVNATTGAVASSSTGKYLRTQAGSNGANAFMYIGDKPFIIVLGIDWVEWTCWSYSGNTSSTATHSNSFDQYIAGTDVIYVPSNSTDQRFTIGFRSIGASDSDRPVLTNEQINTIKSAVKFYVLTDDELSTVGASADAKVTGDVIKSGKYFDDMSLMEVFCPDGISTTSWNFVSGGIYLANGGNFTSLNYCRTATSGGAIYPLLYKETILTLGLPDYEWTAWTYSGNTWSDGSRNLTSGAYIRGDLPIKLNYQNGDNYLSVCVRKKTQTSLSNDDIATIKASFKMLRSASGREDKILLLGDSITRGRIGGQSANARFPIPWQIAEQLGIVCENFGVGNVGWIAGYTQDSPDKTNAIGYLKRVGNSSYYAFNNAWNGYKFIGRGGWSEFNTIAFALGVNDLNYTIGSIEDIDDTLTYAEVMAWKTSAEDSDASNRTIVKAMYQAMRWIRESEANHSDGDPYVPDGKYKNIIIVDPMTGARSTFRNNLCELYTAFCNKYGIRHITSKDTPIDPLNITTYLPDEVHPNETTYAMLSRYFAAKF